MGKVIFNITVSLDGFVAGPHDGPENGLGDGGDSLHKWYFSGDTEVRVSEGTPMLRVSAQSAARLKQAISTQGAGVWGRRTFDIAKGWGGHPPIAPAFVVTHHVPPEWVRPGSPFTFVTEGVESAIRQAKQAAEDKDVVICTASILQQGLKMGLVDELYLDVAPVLLGAGVRLFDHLAPEPVELESIQVAATPAVNHLVYRVVRPLRKRS